MYSIKRDHRLWLGLMIIAIAVSGCKGAPPPDPASKVIAQKKKTPERKVRRVRPANLNSANNLKGSGAYRYGFELPMGTKKTEMDASRYIVTTSARLLRFFGSRKLLVRKRTDGWQITHTELSLRTLPEADEAWQRAALYLHRGPGPGFTIRFDSGIPKARPQPALLTLIERERSGSAKVSVTKSVASDKKKEAPLIASKRRSNSQKKSRPTSPPRMKGSASTPSARLKRFSLSRLKRSALRDRSRPGRTLDVSKRVYKWTQKKGQSFKD